MLPEIRPDLEYFSWKDIIIYQQDDVLKVGTDALLLGVWVPRVSNQVGSILDAGTGGGILALMMAKAFPEAIVTAMDIDDRAIRLVQLNVQHSKWNERIHVVRGDITEPGSADQSGYDLVLSNPPYFSNGPLPMQDFNLTAKHNLASVESWVQGLTSRLKPGGHLCLVVPAQSAYSWIAAVNTMRYYCCDRLDVYSFAADRVAKRSLLHFTNELQRPGIDQLVIHSDEQHYTQAYLDLAGIAVPSTLIS